MPSFFASQTLSETPPMMPMAVNSPCQVSVNGPKSAITGSISILMLRKVTKARALIATHAKGNAGQGTANKEQRNWEHQTRVRDRFHMDFIAGGRIGHTRPLYWLG